MERIFDSVRMAEPVEAPGDDAEVARRKKPRSLGEAQRAVLDFLNSLPDTKSVSITKLVVLDREERSWEAEVKVHVPNATIETLGLPVQKAVLDCERRLLRLDGDLNVVAYGPSEGE